MRQIFWRNLDKTSKKIVVFNLRDSPSKSFEAFQTKVAEDFWVKHFGTNATFIGSKDFIKEFANYVS